MRSWQGPDPSGFETVSVLYCKDNRKIKNKSKQENDMTFLKNILFLLQWGELIKEAEECLR